MRNPAIGQQRERYRRDWPRTPIIVRSLKQVGGERPDRKYQRKKDRKAREAGFASHSSWVDFVIKAMQKRPLWGMK